MNKKLLSVLLALSMMTGAAALAEGYTAGTYTGLSLIPHLTLPTIYSV